MEQNEQFETKLNILADILAQKREALLAILAISENQENLYNSPATNERRGFLLEMGKQKQVHIDEVLTCDEVFQGIFGSISGIFEQMGKTYPGQVKALQRAIGEVLELDIKIRAQEEKTKSVARVAWGTLGKAEAAAKEPTAAGKNYLLEQYRNNNRNRPKN
ncbi:MAG: hypothetical protein LBE35_05995 [Clostridiales bacterium]|jgi:hypothetical protein|nr:hypothetical protein [Clostridiales bacterium]